MKPEAERLFWKGVLAGLTVPFLVAFGAFTGAFPIMLALGVANHEISDSIPALGFWPVVLLSWGLGSLITKFRHKYDFNPKK